MRKLEEFKNYIKAGLTCLYCLKLPKRSGEIMEIRANYSAKGAVQIRSETLQPANFWAEPTLGEITEIIRLAGLTDEKVAELLGLKKQKNKGDKCSRTVRRWVSGESKIPYAAWAILAYTAGFGAIWETV